MPGACIKCGGAVTSLDHCCETTNTHNKDSADDSAHALSTTTNWRHKNRCRRAFEDSVMKADGGADDCQGLRRGEREIVRQMWGPLVAAGVMDGCADDAGQLGRVCCPGLADAVLLCTAGCVVTEASTGRELVVTDARASDKHGWIFTAEPVPAAAGEAGTPKVVVVRLVDLGMSALHDAVKDVVVTLAGTTMTACAIAAESAVAADAQAAASSSEPGPGPGPGPEGQPVATSEAAPTSWADVTLETLSSLKVSELTALPGTSECTGSADGLRAQATVALLASEESARCSAHADGRPPCAFTSTPHTFMRDVIIVLCECKLLPAKMLTVGKLGDFEPGNAAAFGRKVKAAKEAEVGPPGLLLMEDVVEWEGARRKGRAAAGNKPAAGGLPLKPAAKNEDVRSFCNRVCAHGVERMRQDNSFLLGRAAVRCMRSRAEDRLGVTHAQLCAAEAAAEASEEASGEAGSEAAADTEAGDAPADPREAATQMFLQANANFGVAHHEAGSGFNS